MCQIHICPQDSPVTWHEQRRTSYGLQTCHHSQTVIRCQCMVGFTTATDRQRLEALIRRGIRSGLCGADVSSLAELVDSADDALFNAFYTYNPNHVYTHCYPISTQQDTISDIVVMTEFYLQRLEVCRLIPF